MLFPAAKVMRYAGGVAAAPVKARRWVFWVVAVVYVLLAMGMVSAVFEVAAGGEGPISGDGAVAVSIAVLLPLALGGAYALLLRPRAVRQLGARWNGSWEGTGVLGLWASTVGIAFAIAHLIWGV